MKPRRVFVTLEIETDAWLDELRAARFWSVCIQGPIGFNGHTVRLLQAQANVAQTRGGDAYGEHLKSMPSKADLEHVAKWKEHNRPARKKAKRKA